MQSLENQSFHWKEGIYIFSKFSRHKKDAFSKFTSYLKLFYFFWIGLLGEQAQEGLLQQSSISALNFYFLGAWQQAHRISQLLCSRRLMKFGKGTNVSEPLPAIIFFDFCLIETAFLSRKATKWHIWNGTTVIHCSKTAFPKALSWPVYQTHSLPWDAKTLSIHTQYNCRHHAF